MFGRYKSPKHIYDAPIENVLAGMNFHGLDSERYPDLLVYLQKLSALKTEETNRHRKPSPDAILAVIGNVLTVLVIVAYEQKHVLSTKAMGLVGRIQLHVTPPKV